jgi:hypothetical protein
MPEVSAAKTTAASGRAYINAITKRTADSGARTTSSLVSIAPYAPAEVVFPERCPSATLMTGVREGKICALSAPPCLHRLQHRDCYEEPVPTSGAAFSIFSACESALIAA